jgi:Bifunctional DNA primase/polymerase, N-terminal
MALNLDDVPNHLRDLAVVWCRNKVCRQRDWQLTTPDPARLAREWGQKIRAGYEPAINLRESGLIGLEADSKEDAGRLLATTGGIEDEQLYLREVRGDRMHLYFRQPAGALPKVSFRFEGGTLVAAKSNYFRSAYPAGPYTVESFNPDAPPMERATYDRLMEAWSAAKREVELGLRAGRPLAEGSRRNSVFRFGAFLTRWVADEERAVELADIWQQAHCDPPIPYDWVAQQVHGAYVIGEAEDRLGCEDIGTLPLWARRAIFKQALRSWTPFSAEIAVRGIQ